MVALVSVLGTIRHFFTWFGPQPQLLHVVHFHRKRGHQIQSNDSLVAYSAEAIRHDDSPHFSEAHVHTRASKHSNQKVLTAMD